jgi:hypothetical protein
MKFLHTNVFSNVSNVERVGSRLAHQYESLEFRSHFFGPVQIKILKLSACRSSYYDETDMQLRYCVNLVETFKLIFVQLTAKTQYRKFETNIPREGAARMKSQIYINVSVSDLYIPLIGLPILLQENKWAERGNI